MRILAYSLILIFICSSCSNYKLNYTDAAKDWKANKPTEELAVRHTTYLIGDTGNAKEGQSIPIFKYLKNDLEKESENSSIIFLGDNIYPVGMPPKSDKVWRELAEHKLDVQIDMLDNFKGKIMWIPGNHDWSKYGVKGLKRQEKYLEKELNKKRNGTDDKHDDAWEDFMFPGDGCGDPYLVEINDQLVFILLDSEWWIQNWDQDEAVNEGCSVKTREAFFLELEGLTRKYRNRNVVVAMHHPIFSNGPHGGYFTAKDHLFPLRAVNKNLYVPLPGIGSVISFARATIGVPQDIAHPKYKALKKDVLRALTKNGSNIIVSGHEHNLQYHFKKNQHMVISGAGSKENPSRVGNGGEFGYARLGYSKMEFYEDGTTWLYYYALNDDKSGMEEVFRKKIKGELPISEDNIPASFPEFENNITSKTRKPTNFKFKERGAIHTAILGTHYSDLYLKDYEFKTLDITNFEGGLTPIKRGGGMQTNSLRMENPVGNHFVMRSLTKDASRMLTYPVNKMRRVKSLLQDNFMSAHPFAALMVTDMAKAANINHTNPEVYYIPKQPRLSVQNDLFGGDVYLVEERPGGSWEDLESFGNSKKIISTIDVLEKIQKNEKHRVDQNWVARSRLFDMVIKDWDRHDDQWRWARFEDENGKYYRPIPRDRDQAFSKYDGFLTRCVAAVNPFMKQLNPYRSTIKKIQWMSWNARFFDNNFLNELEWEDWQKEAAFIQKNVTDEVIEKSLSNIPTVAQNEEWKQMVMTTKQRRDNVMDFARRHYLYKAKQVDVVGTSEKDIFEVQRLSDNQTLVRQYSKKREKLVYERLFNHNETKEVHLYGLQGDDEFNISGDVNTSLKIRIIGGTDDDEINENSNVARGGKRTLVYDSDYEKNELNLGTEGKDKTSNRSILNTYDRKSYHYNPPFSIVLPIISFNPDDGVILGTSITRFKYQFKKFPYGQKHVFDVNYSLGTQALNVGYNGEFIEAVGTWDLVTDIRLRRPRYAFNYFGFGNESGRDDEKDISFYRVRQSTISTSVELQKRFANDQGKFTIGPFIERTKIVDTPDRFVTTDDSLPQDIFDQRIYTGLGANFNFENVDNITDPHKGLRFELGYDYELNILNTDFNFGRFKSALSIYTPIGRAEKLVFANKFGYESISGEYDFFKAPLLGGVETIRGLNEFRLRGEQVFYHKMDLRYNLLTSVNSVLPFSVGLHGGLDYGRTWTDGEDSERWHYSYGGGFYFDPLEVVVFSFGAYFSEDNSRFILAGTHMF